MSLSDTDPSAARLQESLLRALPEQQRAEIARGLTLSVQRLAFAGMRARFPSASDDEIWLRLAVHRLGAEMVRKAYGRLPGE